MYEHNEETYFALLLNSESMGDMLNKAEYITKISEYDRKMLEKFNDTVNFITAAKIKLEQDRETLVVKQEELTDISLGIDLGLKDLAVCSDGKVFKNINKTKVK